MGRFLVFAVHLEQACHQCPLGMFQDAQCLFEVAMSRKKVKLKKLSDKRDCPVNWCFPGFSPVTYNKRHITTQLYVHMYVRARAHAHAHTHIGNNCFTVWDALQYYLV